MPIRPAFRALYPSDWPALSRHVRFDRAGGRCQACGRPHLARVRCLPDGRWFDEAAQTWRDRRGRPARWPDLIEVTKLHQTRVVLAAAHLDHNPAHNRWSNLRGLCQRCHMLHDRPFHLVQRWLTYRRRWAMGDLFLGVYEVQMPLDALMGMIGRPGASRLSPHDGSAARRVSRHTPTLAGIGDLFAVAR